MPASTAPPGTISSGDLPTLPAAPAPLLAGARCQGGDGHCRCRTPGTDDAESTPPEPGHKRFEIRLAAGGGQAVLASAALGRFEAAGDREACYYVDVISGTAHDVVFLATEARKGEGVAPLLKIAEYGPKGPWWYDILAVSCDGASGRCDRPAADAWGQAIRARKRGRLDPCGSTVVTRLQWRTSGGESERDSGLFRDFAVSFNFDVKRFETQLAPGTVECAPR